MSASFDFKSDPLQNFAKLFAEAEQKTSKDPNAMSLATVDSQGNPSLRTVLFKGMVRQGFSFYTNYESQKSKELLSSKQAALLFFWSALDRQIRIEGVVEKLTRAESESYFKTRARLSQLGAWASHQSQKINSLEDLERRVQELDKQYEGQSVPCPNNWGGFHVLPLKMEFWFGRTGRLHERYVYQRKDLSSPWTTSMLAP